jgi:hypothetical protein
VPEAAVSPAGFADAVGGGASGAAGCAVICTLFAQRTHEAQVLESARSPCARSGAGWRRRVVQRRSRASSRHVRIGDFVSITVSRRRRRRAGLTCMRA